MYKIQINEKGMSSYSVDNSDSIIDEDKNFYINPNLTKYKTTSDKANYFSYGKIKGNFYIPDSKIREICLNKIVQQNYAFREKKSDYYRLMFDFDYKANNIFIKPFLKCTENITNDILIKIKKVLENIFNIKNNDDLNYVYSKNNKGLGVHIYFYNLIVNSHLHFYIRNQIIKELNNDNFISQVIKKNDLNLSIKNTFLTYIKSELKINKDNYKEANKNIDSLIRDTIIKQLICNNNFELLETHIDNFIRNNIYFNKVLDLIIDETICKNSSIRLFYLQKNEDESYYYPDNKLSTIKINNNPSDDFKYCLVNTNNIKDSHELKIDENIIYNSLIFTSKKNIKKEIAIDKIEGFTFLSLGDNENLIKDLIKALDINKRFSDYKSWISLVFLFRNYNLYDEIIKYSKKITDKFDNKSLETINKIFKKDISEIENKKMIKIGSLIKFASEDNFYKTVKIMEKYNLQLQLKLNKSEDLLLCNHKDSIDYIENSKYISETFLNEIIKKQFDPDNTNKIYIIQSATGSGKTTLINSLLNKLNFKKIISIVSRRSMISTHKVAFNKYKLSSYLDEIQNKKRFISSLEYLGNLYDTDYNCVILDEITSLLNHFYSDTMSNRRRASLYKLRQIIDNADIVIACDAHINECVLEFFEKLEMPFYFYKNTFKNKINIPLNLYTAPEKTNQSDAIISFCELIKDDVIKKKSILIFSDSRAITIFVKKILMRYNSNESDYLLFNRDSGDLNDLNNLNTLAVNKITIASPSIIYGVDLLVNFDNIYCIYKNVSKDTGMSPLEYIQQYSRARNTKAINILITNSKYMQFKNKFISFKKNKQIEKKDFRLFKKEYNKIIKKYNLVNELLINNQLNDEIDDNSLFSAVHYYKTWYDRLFSNNKIQLIKLLAEESGLTINDINLKITKSINDLTLKDSIIEFENKIVSLSDKIYNEIKDFNDNDKKIAINIMQQIENRKKYLDLSDLKLQNDDYLKKIITSEDEFNTYINKKYLEKPKDEFEKFIANMAKVDLAYIQKDNKLINKIKILFKIEELINFERFKLRKIKPNDEELKKIKENLLKMNDEIIIFFQGLKSKKCLSIKIKNQINKINCPNKLAKWIANLYNSFGNVIKIGTKIKLIKIANNKRKKITIYKFKFIK